MRRSVSIFVGLLAAAVLAACAPMHGAHHYRGGPKMGAQAHGAFKDNMNYVHCAHACELWVHVAGTVGGSCTASVKVGRAVGSADADVVVVRGNGSKTFSFKMATSGFEFAGDGIKVENDPGDFTNGASSPTLRTKILARNSDLHLYKYSVETKKSGAVDDCHRFDPMIINRD